MYARVGVQAFFFIVIMCIYIVSKIFFFYCLVLYDYWSVWVFSLYLWVLFFDVVAAVGLVQEGL